MKHINLLSLLLLMAVFLKAKPQSDTPLVTLYPNPTTDWINLSITSAESQAARMLLLNTQGATVMTDSVQLAKGANTLTFSVKDQNAGVYFCQLTGNSWAQTTKVVLTKSAAPVIDIIHYDLSLSIQNLATKTISGTAKLKLVCGVNGLGLIKLDLLKLAVSTVMLNDTAQAFSQTDTTLSITLSSPKQAGDTIELAITYSGQPVTDAQWGGFYFSGNYAYNMGVGFKSNPHNFGRCWFPCADNFTDRATYSFHITTDATFKAVCNGLMLPETPNMDGSTTWNWQQNQSIPTYLASVAVGKYEFVKYDFVGTNRTYPVWIAVVAADTAKAKISFAKVSNALHCFEQKYGPYPFDRVGYVGVPFSSGAMEHAANIAYPNYAINGNTVYETLFAHELSHMWWGDLATTRTAAEMWLNEGWASFNEALFLECVYGKAAYTNDIEAKAIDVLLNAPKDDGAWLPVSGVPHEVTYGTHVYKKGALMVHTLRALMGDSAFFAATKHYLAQYSFKDVSTEDLKNAFQQFTPKDLGGFFQKWIYTQGHSDIVMSSFSQNGENYHAEFYELSAQNSLVTASLPFTFTAVLSNATTFQKALQLQNGQASFDTVLPASVSVIDYAVNADYKVQLAHLSQTQAISTTGSKTFSNVLFSANVQTTSGNDSLTITHHWVGPLAGTIRQQGIQPSTERYWTIAGNLNSNFKATGFFSYDGNPNSFLDAALITQTEDSLVLLYRPDVNTNWMIHTDHTFQPGASKTDKTGRFWVNSLQKGEYTFGMRKAVVVGLKEETSRNTSSFKIVPNPADTDGQIKIVFNSKTYVKQVVIRDMQGKTVKKLTIESFVENLPLSIQELPAGQYIVTSIFKDSSASQQFLKK